MSVAYLLHFSKPYHHARHYIGFTKGDLAERLERHRSGRGANIIRVVIAAGITVHLARAWHGAPRFWEVKLKAHGHAHRFCPYCYGTQAFQRGCLPEA